MIHALLLEGRQPHLLELRCTNLVLLLLRLGSRRMGFNTSQQLIDVREVVRVGLQARVEVPFEGDRRTFLSRLRVRHVERQAGKCAQELGWHLAVLHSGDSLAIGPNQLGRQSLLYSGLCELSRLIDHARITSCHV